MPTVSTTDSLDPAEQYGQRWGMPNGVIRWAVISSSGRSWKRVARKPWTRGRPSRTGAVS